MFFKDFGIEVAFSRNSTPVATSTMILNSSTADIAVHDRSFYDAKFYEAKALGSKIELLGPVAEVAGVEQGDKATVNAVDYYVFAIEPDATGLTTITLTFNPI